VMGTTDDTSEAGAGAPPEQGRDAWFPCPYCGQTQDAGAAQCTSCSGLFEPLSRQATQNHMGPWQVRDPGAPFMPGRSYTTIRRMAQRGKIAPDDVLRGPTTRQFWMAAAEIPGVAHLLGKCHSCKHDAKPDAFSCTYCGAAFPTPEDRQHLGVAPVRLLPGQAPPTLVARSAAPAEPAPAPGAPPTAFAALARAASPASSPRPTEPSELAPAAHGGAPAVVRGSGNTEPAPEYSRALRASNRRVSALKAVVIVLVVVNAALLAIAATALLRGAEPAGGPASQETPASSE